MEHNHPYGSLYSVQHSVELLHDDSDLQRVDQHTIYCSKDGYDVNLNKQLPSGTIECILNPFLCKSAIKFFLFS